MFPIDTIKTHVQASQRHISFRSVSDILYQEHGMLRFWKGTHVMALGCIPSHTSYFIAYEHLKIFFGYNNEQFDFKQTLCIGATTTFVHDFFIAPSEVIKQRLQLCNGLTARQCCKDIVKEEGIKGLYRSYPITVMMNIPFASSVVCCNENLKTKLKPWDRSNPLLWYFICAGISGGFAGLLTNPLDVIKTRLQT